VKASESERERARVKSEDVRVCEREGGNERLINKDKSFSINRLFNDEQQISITTALVRALLL